MKEDKHEHLGQTRNLHRLYGAVAQFAAMAASVGMAYALSGCSATPTGPEEVPAWVYEEWRIGQERVVEALGGDTAAFGVLPEHFRLEPVDGPFECSGVTANGCYTNNGRLRYNRQTPNVIRHEAGHAILHKLGKKCWKKFEHSDFPYGCGR